MSSRAKPRDLTNAEHVTQVGKVLRSEPDWHSAQDDIRWVLVGLGILGKHRLLNRYWGSAQQIAIPFVRELQAAIQDFGRCLQFQRFRYQLFARWYIQRL